MAEASFEVEKMGVNPCRLCGSRDVRYTDHGIQCAGCSIMIRESAGEGFEDVRERWNALPAHPGASEGERWWITAERIDLRGAHSVRTITLTDHPYDGDETVTLFRAPSPPDSEPGS